MVCAARVAAVAAWAKHNRAFKPNHGGIVGVPVVPDGRTDYDKLLELLGETEGNRLDLKAGVISIILPGAPSEQRRCMVVQESCN